MGCNGPDSLEQKEETSRGMVYAIDREAMTVDVHLIYKGDVTEEEHKGIHYYDSDMFNGALKIGAVAYIAYDPSSKRFWIPDLP